MKDIDEIRRANLRALQEEFGGPSATAKRLDMSLAQFANLRDGAADSHTGKPRGMRKSTARRIESLAGKPPMWLDRDHTAEAVPLSKSEARLIAAYRQTDDAGRELLERLAASLTLEGVEPQSSRG